MAWVTPTARTTGEFITAAIWNQDVVDNANLLKTGIANDGSIFGPLQGYREKQQTIAIAAGVVTVNPLSGSHVQVTMGAAITSFSISNIPATGNVLPVIFHLIGDGTARAITWSVNTKTVKFPGNAPLATSTGTLNKIDDVMIWTRDGDTSWEGKILGLNI